MNTTSEMLNRATGQPQNVTHVLPLSLHSNIISPQIIAMKKIYLVITISLLTVLGLHTSAQTVTTEANPFAPARNFGIFIEDSMVVYGKENKTNNACGGNFIMAGPSGYNTGSNGIGTYIANSDPRVTSTYIGGTLKSLAGGYMKVQGSAYIKIKNMAGINCNLSGNVTTLSIGNTKVVSNDNSQTCANVTQMGNLNIPTAFNVMRSTNSCLAQKTDNVTFNSAGFVDCSNNRYNFLTLTVSQLDSVWKITTNADANHFLCINVRGNGEPVHLVNGGFDTKTSPEYSMINITNIPSLYFDAMQTNFEFSILAPNTHGYFDTKEQHGQLVFKNYNQTDKIYQHPHLFVGKFECEELIIVPVTLTKFSGSLVRNNPELSWSTVNEEGIVSYEIERSANGTSFNKVGTTASLRTSTTNSYKFTDRQPLSGINYYRLKIIDNTGHSVYSNIISIDVQVKGVIINSVSPNPFMSEISLVMSCETASMVSIRLTDEVGRVVSTQNTMSTKGVNTIKLKNLSALSSGLYVIEVRTNNFSEKVKLMK